MNGLFGSEPSKKQRKSVEALSSLNIYIINWRLVKAPLIFFVSIEGITRISRVQRLSGVPDELFRRVFIRYVNQYLHNASFISHLIILHKSAKRPRAKRASTAGKATWNDQVQRSFINVYIYRERSRAVSWKFAVMKNFGPHPVRRSFPKTKFWAPLVMSVKTKFWAPLVKSFLKTKFWAPLVRRSFPKTNFGAPLVRSFLKTKLWAPLVRRFFLKTKFWDLHHTVTTIIITTAVCMAICLHTSIP